MPDREKVIKGLECCTKKVCIYKDTEKECPYLELCGEYEDAFEDCTSALAKDALALLKAQEPRVMAGAELTDAELIEKIRKAPIVLKPNVDAVPVVRCRDCKHRDPEDKKCDYGGMAVQGLFFPRPDDWYCAYGERRESE